MRIALIFCVTLVLSLPLAAQKSVAEAAAQAKAGEPALAADAPSRDQVMTLLNLMQVRKAMTAAMEGMKQIMKDSAEQSFRERVPDATPKQLEALRAMFDDILAAMPLDEMENAIVAIYQRHLTKTDVEEMIRFYSSPVGKKLVQEQPQIMQESMQAGAAIQEKRVGEIQAKIQQRMQQLIEASQPPKPAK
jgi:uncharacterized protein